jgi:hypothetical protein
VNNSGEVRWEVHVADMGEMRNLKGRDHLEDGKII